MSVRSWSGLGPLRLLLAVAVLATAAGVARASVASGAEQDGLRALLGQWLAAWRAQDLEAYAVLYAPDARIDARDRAQFVEHKRRVFARGERPGIRIGDLEIDAVDVGGERLVRARFEQDYRSPSLSDFGRKEILVRVTADGMSIVRETWSAAAGVIDAPFGEGAVAGAPAPPVPEDRPLLAGGPAAVPPPPDEQPAATPGPDDDDLLESRPLLAPPPPELTMVGLPGELLGDGHRVVEEIVARINGRILTRSMYLERIAWYQETLLAEDPPDLGERLKVLAMETLDTTIDRWILLDEAKQMSADIESFWREWLVLFRKQIGAADMEELEQLLTDQGTSLQRLREQVVETEIPNMYLQQEIAGRLTFSEAELRDHFEKNRTRYQPPSRVTFRQILLPSGENADFAKAEGLARHVIDQLAAGRDWCELNQVYGTQGSTCEDLPGIALTDLLPELREAAAGLPLGAVSKPIRSPQGYHVLRVSAREGAEPVSFESMRETVLKEVRGAAFEAELERVLQDLRASAQIDINERYRAPAQAAQGSAGS